MRYRLKVASWTVVRESSQPSPRILDDPAVVAQLGFDLIREADDDKEHFWLILLNAKNHYLLHTLISTGTQSATLVHPREVIGPALREGAASILIVHNHPSGDPTPSSEDVRLTRQIADGARIVDIRLHDHVIIGNGSERWISFVQRGIL